MKMRIGFFISFPFHREILAPIHAQLEPDFPCLFTSDVEQIIAFQPHVLVVSDRFLPQYREKLAATILIYTRHGFISKNYSWGVFGEADFVCVSSPWVRDDSARRGWRPQMGFWVTGFTLLDKVLAARQAGKAPALPSGFSRRGPTLLYAPTFNPLLNSIEMLGTNWIRRLRERHPNLNVILKPHPHTAEHHPKGLAILRELAASNERTWLVPADANIYELMPMAGMLMSDASSVPFYYLAWDRPVILVTNPRRFEEPRFFDPEGQEWTWRDMAVEIDHADALPAAFQSCVDHPEEKAERRAFYRERVFGNNLTGDAAARIASKVRALARPSAEDQPWVEIAWNSCGAIRRLQRRVTALDPTGARSQVVVDLEKYPQLWAAVKQRPGLRAELAKVVESALRARSGAPSSTETFPPEPIDVRNH